MTKFNDFDLDLNQIKENNENQNSAGLTGIKCDFTLTYITACDVTCDGDKCIWPVTRNCSPSDMTACYANNGDARIRC